jgi:hypothetical protein
MAPLNLWGALPLKMSPQSLEDASARRSELGGQPEPAGTVKVGLPYNGGPGDRQWLGVPLGHTAYPPHGWFSIRRPAGGRGA